MEALFCISVERQTTGTRVGNIDVVNRDKALFFA